MNTILLDTLLGIGAIGGSAAVAIAVEIAARTRLESVTGSFYSIVAVVSGLLLFGLVAAVLLRVLRSVSPLAEGEHKRPSRAFTRWKLDFNLQESAYRTLGLFVPVFGRTWLFRLLGARIASPVVVAGTLTDPAVTRIGRRTIIGGGAFITCHVITEDRFSLHPVTLGTQRWRNMGLARLNAPSNCSGATVTEPRLNFIFTKTSACKTCPTISLWQK